MPEKPERAEESESPDTCPYVNLNDVRCSSRFSLGRIDQAFSVCFGSFHACPMYHRINAESYHQRPGTARNARIAKAERVEAAGYPVIALTSHGQAVPLRPTGS